MVKTKRWSIDAADRRSLSDVRHAVIGELKSVTDNPDDRFAAEILIGEILIEEAASHPQAVALEIVHAKDDATLHIYSQVDTSDKIVMAELQQNLASKCGLPLRLYISPQGVHIEVTFARKNARKNRLKSLWDVACCVLAARTQRILRRRPADDSASADDAGKAAV